jgi:DNA-binding GntR family transcriptional regulator
VGPGLTRTAIKVSSGAAKNKILYQVTQTLAKRVRWYFARVVLERGSHSVEEHEELLDAIRRRDGERAAAIAGSHIERTRDAARSVVIGQQEPQPVT